MSKTTLLTVKYFLIFLFLFCSYFGFSQQKYCNEVYFSSDSDSLTLASIKRIDSLIMKINPAYKTEVFIAGHCDSIGDEKYNYDLSLRRAHSVETYIVGKKVKPDSFMTCGYGDTRLKYKTNEWGKNRRAEITVTVISTEEKKVVVKKDTVKPSIAGFVDSAKIGDKMALQNITFYGGSDIPLPESYKTLDELFTSLKDKPSVEISIEGHICCFNNDVGNLSGKRAKAVYDYLVNKGIGKDRLSYKGLGHSQPLTNERNELERQMNRRVEIRVMKK